MSSTRKTKDRRAKAAGQMAVTMARLLQNGETVFHGVASPLPMVSILLARDLHAPDLVYLSIAGGVNGSPLRPPYSTVDPSLLRASQSIFPLTDVFDLSSRGGLDVAFLSGAEIDGHGSINLSAIGDIDRPKVRLPGGAGSAAILPTCRKTILWRTRHDTETFVKRVTFASASGPVYRVVTPLCVFRGTPSGLLLDSVHEGHTLAEVKKQTAFDVREEAPVAATPPPTEAEIEALSRIDPDCVRLSEF